MLKAPRQAAEKVVEWIRNYFAVNAPEASAVIGISGGKDSSIAAALCAAALGKERVVGAMMPDGAQTDLQDSYTLVRFLEIPFLEINIQDITGALKLALENSKSLRRICGRTTLAEQAEINAPPRIRMTLLYAVAQNLPAGGLVVNTGNRSEAYVGYSTKYGDAAGDFSPLAGFTVREVRQLGDALGLPRHLVNKAPADGLSGVTDETKLGFRYEALDEYIETGSCSDAEAKSKIDALHRKNLHKLQPIPFYQKKDND